METLLDWIAAHPHWAGAGIFLVAFSESLAIVGLFMPGALLMFGIGALIALGHLDFLPTMAWAVAGAVCGDGLSFWLGRHYHQELRAIWPFRNYPRLINRGVDFFHRHGGKSIALGRFVGPVRPIMPAVAGMLEMPTGRYVVINLISGLVWAPAYLLPGMAFGASLELAAAVTGRLVVLLLLLAVLLWATFALARVAWRLAQGHTRMAVLRLLDWGRHHPRFAALTRAVGDPGGPEARGLAVLGMTLLVGTALLSGLLDLAVTLPTDTDRTLHGLLVGLRNPPADVVLIAATQLGDGLFVLLYGLAAAVLLARVERSAALHWLAALGFALLAPVLLKALVAVPRPDGFADQALGSSFPSAHALRAAVLYGFAAVLLARVVAPAWRWVPYVLAALLAITVALSRPYLGVHWPLDVVAGLLVGAAWVVLLGTAFRVRAPSGPAQRGLAAALLAPWLLLALVYVPTRLPGDLDRYTVQVPLQTLDAAAWANDPWPALTAAAPETVAGTGPVLVWAAPLEVLSAQLARTGWAPPEATGAAGWLRMLAPETPLADLPLLPQVHDGREEVLRLVRVEDDASRLVLRLWPSGLRLAEGAPVWLGRIDRESRARLLGLVAYARGVPAPAEAITEVVEVLAASRPGVSTPVRVRPAP